MEITPKTNQIYAIWAVGPFESTPHAKKEQAVLMALLEKKYGAVEPQSISDAVSDVQRINAGNRYIFSKVTGLTEITLDLRYYDTRLQALAEKERIAIEAEKVDSGGL